MNIFTHTKINVTFFLSKNIQIYTNIVFGLWLFSCYVIQSVFGILKVYKGGVDSDQFVY